MGKSNWAERLVARQFERERQGIRTMAARSAGAHALDADIEHGVLMAEARNWARVLTEIAHNQTEPAARATFVELTRSRRGKSTIDWAAVLAEFGPLDDRWRTEVHAYIQMTAGKKIADIRETTLEAVRAALAEGVAAGESIPKIAKRIDALYLKQIIPNRSVVIARTETIAASNLGSLAGAMATGLNVEKEWLAADDSRTRRSHDSADGQRRPVAEPFVVNGSQLLFPGDSSMGAQLGSS